MCFINFIFKIPADSGFLRHAAVNTDRSACLRNLIPNNHAFQFNQLTSAKAGFSNFSSL